MDGVALVAVALWVDAREDDGVVEAGGVLVDVVVVSGSSARLLCFARLGDGDGSSRRDWEWAVLGTEKGSLKLSTLLPRMRARFPSAVMGGLDEGFAFDEEVVLPKGINKPSIRSDFALLQPSSNFPASKMSAFLSSDVDDEWYRYMNLLDASASARCLVEPCVLWQTPAPCSSTGTDPRVGTIGSEASPRASRSKRS